MISVCNRKQANAKVFAIGTPNKHLTTAQGIDSEADFVQDRIEAAEESIEYVQQQAAEMRGDVDEDIRRVHGLLFDAFNTSTCLL